jgi:hypothetical protein
MMSNITRHRRRKTNCLILRGKPTERQANWVRAIYAKLRAGGAR